MQPRPAQPRRRTRRDPPARTPPAPRSCSSLRQQRQRLGLTCSSRWSHRAHAALMGPAAPNLTVLALLNCEFVRMSCAGCIFGCASGGGYYGPTPQWWTEVSPAVQALRSTRSSGSFAHEVTSWVTCASETALLWSLKLPSRLLSRLLSRLPSKASLCRELPSERSCRPSCGTQ